MIFIIILILFIILSIIDQQYSNILIYSVLIIIAIIPSEIIERIFKKNAQKRIVSDLIEKKVEIEKIQSTHLSTIDKGREKDQKALVFVSYATKDAEVYKIRELAANLTKYERISDVLYWQEDMKDNIIKYMNDNLGKCDVMLLFCSPNALASEPVEKEWTAADIIGKPIIPIFNNPDHIPTLLKPRLGIKFDPFNFQKNIDEIYNLIMKKIE
ncbi:MAG: toll/interleukin-1 receptor domain-containing protein [Promethearchaeota archaeon]